MIEVRSVFRPLVIRLPPSSKASDKAKELFDDAIDMFSCAYVDVIPGIVELELEAPSCGTVSALKGICGWIQDSNGPGAHQKWLPSSLDAELESRIPHTHESTLPHIRVAQELCKRNPLNAISILETRLLHCPHDILALRVVQDLYLKSGKPKQALSCVERVFGDWDTHIPGYSRMLGLHSLGLVSCGHFVEAEEAAGRSLNIATDNIIATKATAYSCAIRSRHREGMRLLRELGPSFDGTDNRGNVSPLYRELLHLKAIFNTEIARSRVALRTVDTIANNRLGKLENAGIIGNTSMLEYRWEVNALWRIKLVNMDAGPQLQPKGVVSAIFGSSEESKFVDINKEVAARFANLQDLVLWLDDEDKMIHITNVLALVGGDNVEGAEKYASHLQDRTSLVVLLSSAIIAFGKKDFSSCSRILLSSKEDWGQLDGIETQQDLFSQLLVISLLKQGGVDFEHPSPKSNRLEDEIESLFRAKAEIGARLMRHQNSPQSWYWYYIVQQELGDANAAELALTKANDLGLNQGGADSN